MPYDPDIHHRRSTRLKGYDYAAPAAYFVTLCTHDRACLFGAVCDGVMHLNACGHIIEEEWRRSEDLRAEVVLDAYIVMPNHLHGLVVIVPPDADPTLDYTDPCGYRLDAAAVVQRSRRDMARHVPTNRAFGHPVAGSLSTILGAFKSAATRRINALRGTPGGKVWQGRFHDRILRDEREWRAARRYIEQNPARWEEDKMYRE